MTSEQFIYWLQGFSEISGEAPTKAQWKSIQDHLSLVFKKVTPYRDNHTRPIYSPFDQAKAHC